jgi:hydrogenase-4 component B
VALLAGFTCDETIIRFFAPIVASLLGFAGALAATCFIKAFGISFLGEPRSDHARGATEVCGSMKLAMGILAGSCFIFALTAPWIISLLGEVSRSLIGLDTGTPVFTSNGIFISLPQMSEFSPLIAGVVLFIAFFLLIVFIKLVGNQAIRSGPSWDCGLPALNARMQYTATGYSKPLRRIFSFFYQPTRRVELEDEGHESLRTTKRFEAGIVHIFDEWIYRPLARLMALASKKAKLIQTGHIQLYLSYIFITLIVLLIYWSRL